MSGSWSTKACSFAHTRSARNHRLQEAFANILSQHWSDSDETNHWRAGLLICFCCYTNKQHIHTLLFTTSYLNVQEALKTPCSSCMAGRKHIFRRSHFVDMMFRWDNHGRCPDPRKWFGLNWTVILKAWIALSKSRFFRDFCPFW